MSLTLSTTSAFSLKAGEETRQAHFAARPDGIWVYIDEDEKALLATLDYLSDRATAIVLGTMVELRLQRALLSKFKRDKNAEQRLFNVSGPLGAFGPKIDLRFSIGLLSEEAFKDLTHFKDIRNLFAHRLDIHDFLSQKIRDKATNLKMIDKLVADQPPGKTGSGINLIDDPLGSGKPIITIERASMRKKSAKERYMLTAQLIFIGFAWCEFRQHRWPLI